jgi:nitrous oxidase accessory protein NosD
VAYLAPPGSSGWARVRHAAPVPPAYALGRRGPRGRRARGRDPAAAGAELTVGTPEYPTIASAVAAAGDGDTVVVPAGVHREHVTIDRGLRLVGRPGAVVDGDGEGTVLRIAAPDVEVRGLTVRGSGTGYTTEDAGIRIERAPGARVVDTRIEDTLFGVFVVESDRCVVEGSTIVGRTCRTCVAATASGSGTRPVAAARESRRAQP